MMKSDARSYDLDLVALIADCWAMLADEAGQEQRVLFVS